MIVLKEECKFKNNNRKHTHKKTTITKKKKPPQIFNDRVDGITF